MKEDIEIIGIIDAKRNANLIEAYSREPYRIALFPDVRYEPSELSFRQNSILENVEQFDWIVFTDPNAAAMFPDIFENTGRELFDLDAVSICAFGESTSDELRFRQIHSDVIPADFTPHTVAREMAVHAQVELSQLSFLVLGSGGGLGEKLVAILISENAECNAIAIAKPSIKVNRLYSKSRALLLGGSVDQFLFGGDREVFDMVAIHGIDTLSSVRHETAFTGTNAAGVDILVAFRLSKQKKAGAKSSGPIQT